MILTTCKPDSLDAQIALAVLTKYTLIVDHCSFESAAKMMGKKLTPEVMERLTMLSGCKYSACPPLVLDFLEKVGMEILKAA